MDDSVEEGPCEINLLREVGPVQNLWGVGVGGPSGPQLRVDMVHTMDTSVLGAFALGNPYC